MNTMRAAIGAFTFRHTPRRTALQLAAWSGVIAVGLVLLAAWVVSRSEPLGLHDYMYLSSRGAAAPEPLQLRVLEVADLMALALVALALLVLAPASVAGAVAAERRAGTLDQLRTTPLSPLALVVGMVVGTPARIYLLAAGPLALHVLCGVVGAVPLDMVASTTMVLLTGGFASVMLALAMALAPRQDAGGGFVALGIAALLGLGALATSLLAINDRSCGWSFLHPGGAVSASLLQYDGLWRRLSLSPWRLAELDHSSHISHLSMIPGLSALSSLLLGGLLAVASCRKLARPHLSLLSKSQALAIFIGLSSALILPFGLINRSYGPNLGELALAAGLMMLPIAATLVLLSTPSVEAWSAGLRGAGAVRWWRDDAAPHVTAWLMPIALGLLVAASPMLGVHGGVRDRVLASLGWLVWLYATLPLYVHFLSTRYSTVGARWAFGAAAVAHLAMQAVAIVLVAERASNHELLFVEVAAVAGVAVPVWVMVRQHLLRRRTLAA